jgi:DNA-binding transcriptional LysR family regulator
MDNKYLSLDVRSLHTFLIIMETGSITAAANQLNITQSAVSHGVEKLRGIFQDKLFLRAGRGIKPTPRAEQLFTELKPLLANISALTQNTEFSPAEANINWKVAANDFQRDIVLPGFYKRVSKQVKSFTLDVIPSEVPPTELLRNGEVDLVISPVPPDAPDILQKQLFSTRVCCFYDANIRKPPKTTEDFLQSSYISLTFMAGRRRPGENPIMEKIEKKIVIRVSNFAGIASFIRGSELLAIVPEMLIKASLADFSQTEFPFDAPELKVYSLWHQRYQNDAMHQWLRAELFKDS